MSEDKAENEPTLVEKWIRDQQDWQKTTMEYFDSMVKNDEFLVHLGNAMRGSLLAGKPYPGTESPEQESAAEALHNRFDEILHTLQKLQGDMADLKMDIDELKAWRKSVLQRAQSESAPPDTAPADSERVGD